MTKHLYPIGTWVWVTHHIVPTYVRKEIARHSGYPLYTENRVLQVIEINPERRRWGQITGMKYLGEGRRENLGEDGICFTTTGTKLCYEVRYGMANRPVYAQAGHFIIAEVMERTAAGNPCWPPPIRLPLRLPNQPEWPDAWRDSLRVEMEDWPRDKWGRWKSKRKEKS